MKRIDDIDIFVEIKRGEYGATYRGFEAAQQRLVLVKAFRKAGEAQNGNQTGARFEQEASIYAQIRHPNVVQVFDFGEPTSRSPYMVMEYLEGPTLAQVLREEGSIALPRALWIFTGICAAIEAGHRVVPIPGASAPLAALVGSGLPSDAFLFSGFLPTKDKARRDRLTVLASVPSTLIFFESPHRIGATLAAAADVLGKERQATVCRELTKAFEEFRRGTLGDLAQYYDDRTVKGEIVLVIAPPSQGDVPAEADVDSLLLQLAADLPVAKAAGEAAKLTGLPRKDLYQRLVELKERNDR